jgi:flavin-binding protein dodecin
MGSAPSQVNNALERAKASHQKVDWQIVDQALGWLSSHWATSVLVSWVVPQAMNRQIEIARVASSMESDCDGWTSVEEQADSRSSFAKGLQARVL